MASAYESNRLAIADEWHKAGLSDMVIAGWLGRTTRESSFDPNALRKNDAGPGNHSRGIMQWNRGRLAGLFKFAQDEGKPWNDVRVQARYALQEINGTHKSTLDRFSSAKNIQDVVDAAMLYEMPKGTVQKDGTLTPRKGMHYKETLEAAKKFAGIKSDPAELMADSIGHSDNPNTIADPKAFNAQNRVNKSWENSITTEAAQIVADSNPDTNTGTRLPTDTPDISDMIGNFMSTKNQKPVATPPSINELASLFGPKLQWASL